MGTEEREEGEREYSLTEAARILNKTEAALRMRIKRGTLRANTRYIDESGDRYQYMIPESEIEREKNRQSSTLGGNGDENGYNYSASNSRAGGNAPTPGTLRQDIRVAPHGFPEELFERLQRVEKELQQEREDVRARIRGLEQQLELLRMMMMQLMNTSRQN